MKCYRHQLHISYKDHITNDIVCNETQAAFGPYEGILTTVKKHKLQWSDPVDSVKLSYKAQYQGKVLPFFNVDSCRCMFCSDVGSKQVHSSTFNRSGTHPNPAIGYISPLQGENHMVTHFQFTSWLDKGVPKYTYPLLAYRRLIRSFDDKSTGPIIVHCR